MIKVMSDIRFYYHKQIKKLEQEAKMKERDYLKYIAEESATKNERSTIKAGMIAQSYGDYYKDIVSDLNAVLDSASYYVECKGVVYCDGYDDNELKALQESINNIQEYKEKLNNQYIK